MPANLCRSVILGALLLCPAAVLGVGQVGERAPDFSLQDTAGETVDVVFGQGDVYLVSFVGYS